MTFCTLLVAACGGGNDKPGVDAGPVTQCNDGIDNDGDGKIDFPDDPGCTSATDDSEDSLPAPQCSDGRDNDGDGKVDYPDDPGCFAPQQDDETDDCPDGPGCPQCGDGKDNDGNGSKDYPNDPGCSSASDNDEFTDNPLACGANVMIKQLPTTNEDKGTFTVGAPSMLTSNTCGGAGGEFVYELRVNQPKVIVATTDNATTTADTVLSLRDATCTANAEVACNDDISADNHTSSISVAVQPGVYYLVVDSPSSSSAGAYDLTVHFFVGEGVTCSSGDECGPGLVCRVPLGGTAKVCSKHVCSDGVDDDGDGKLDFPNDPGCTSADDDDETDDCPNGPNCPACGNGKDDDNDGKIDYPTDPSCSSASATSESCTTHEGVAELTMPMTDDNNATALNDYHLTCGDSDAPDKTYSLNLPDVDTLTIGVHSATFDVFPNIELLGATCSGTAIACVYEDLSKTNIAAGQYYLVVQSDFASSVGDYTITVGGKIKNGASCESPLATSGALTCNNGFGCGGTPGSRTCVPAQCSDGIDNNGDGKIDYPNDPGCTGPNDATEDTVCPGVNCPVCSDGMDNDTDTLIDYPGDYGCAAASGTTEVFCMKDTDKAAQKLIVAPQTTGTTMGLGNDFVPSCGFNSTASDAALALSLPVPVVSLVVDTIGTGFDTILSVTDASCTTVVGCDDDGGGSQTSKVTAANVAAGNYAVIVDAYMSASGPFTVNVKGTVATGTKCEFPAFTQGILVCPGAQTCKGTAGSKTCQP